MAASLSTTIDVHFIKPLPDSRSAIFFSSPVIRQNPTRKRLAFSCSSATKPSQNHSKSLERTNPSLSDQLKSISSTTLPAITKDRQASPLAKPKSVWINPARPKRPVLSLQRQKKSPYSYTPLLEELRVFNEKLYDCKSSEAAFTSVLEQAPPELSREDAFSILKSFRDWRKALLFFNWIKAQNRFPMETIFFNVTMKSLRVGMQFELVEELAKEMVSNEIELDNITYSTIISCAKKCDKFDKALEWFERMYKTGLMPDEVTYSAILDVYAKLGKVEEALRLYERGVASGWKPDPITFSVLAKMFGEAGDFDGIRYVEQEVESLGVKPNLILYNTLLEALGKARKPGAAKSLFEKIVASGHTPNEKTLTSLLKIYGRARWGKDAMELWERMRLNDWPMDFKLCNTLLSMCADIGAVDEAERLFEEMKQSRDIMPDSWSYTAMLNIYGNVGNADKGMELFEEMSEVGLEPNVMGCTCLVQSLGKGGRIDDLVRVFGVMYERGVKVDDRFCGSLLSIVAMCKDRDDADKVVACLQQANPKLVALINSIQQDKTSSEALKEEFKALISETAVEARRPFCNCLIDICRGRNLNERAHQLLYLGTLFGLYQNLHNKTVKQWTLDVRSLSIGAAHTAFEEWMATLTKFVERKEDLPESFTAHTGAGTHKFSLGLANAFAAHVHELKAPFSRSQEIPGCFVATRQDLVNWVQSRIPSALTA